ncbi:aminotransferase class I/II-fold pyridoxal phosphate-dependent enzyme [Shimazuella alba]|uniref:Aminotransferase class I/II-fold pyridoxal phosphate-dependent enzyme n=1 Tax=Shimazuella alba TaxID=2690964 RepID=A0A6I4VVA2_9BACL|nr:aminotransferase class I/II-fold pyridoxal phosphate-dependent enzyme [Shimazuella alba]MXQ54488.1 aminotransferase class I/II-fold pyridoxal phosphate-dependent enzyme [Shimazuella alba]
MTDQSRAPLWEALQKHTIQSKANFHVPGHKAGQVFDKEALPRYSSILPFDLTEVGDLDDLHAPTGVIQEAQQLAAEVFQADYTRFLVGGTTAGILASILTVCKPGDKILVARHCHQSVFHGCLLAGATVVPIPYIIDRVSGLEAPVSSIQVKALLQQHPDAKAVVLTSPTYFGVVQKIEELAKVIHSYKIPLIVDEAHGAHFGFHTTLPKRAMEFGADICIQSTHKMLPSLTMSSMIHGKERFIDRELLDTYLRMIQSSSPSYVLMASLDLSRRYMVKEGESILTNVLRLLDSFRKSLYKLPFIVEKKTVTKMDPLKLSLSSSYFSGFELASQLEDKGVYAELADDQKVLLVFSLGTKQAELDYLLQCLSQIHEYKPILTEKKNTTLLTPQEGEIIPYAECRTRERCRVPAKQAVGKRSAVHLVPYPPGIPIVLMGETIYQETLEYLLFLHQTGGKVRGIEQQDDQYWLSVYN